MKKIIILLILIMAISLSGCFNKPMPEDKNVPISPKSTAQKSKEVSLYFLNDKLSGLNMETRGVSQNADLLRQVMQELIKGPKDEYSKPIIPDGTTLLSIQAKDNTAYVNFSKNYITGNNISSNTAKCMVAGLVNTLTGLPDINSVQILVEGNKLSSMYGYKMGLDPLQRAILTGEVYNNKDRVKKLQENVNQGKEIWRLDPLKVMQFEGGIVGFNGDDSFTIEYKRGGVVSVNATHQNKSYLVTLVQPTGQSDKNIWVISDVKAKFTKIPEADPTKGETFIYGIVKSIDYSTRVVTIQREYQDTQDMNNIVGPNINILPDAIIHLQTKVGSDNQGGYKYTERDISISDIKVGDELGLVLTKNKDARAVIVSDANNKQNYNNIKEDNIKVISPMKDNSVSSPIKVVGKARVYEGTVNIRVIDANGNTISQSSVQASAAAPSWGDFNTDLQYKPLSKPQNGTLQLFTISPKDGSIQDLVSIPIQIK